MKLVWTKSDLPASLLIRWGLRENSSHLVIVFDDKLVFNSEFAGCKVHWYNSYLKTRDPVYQLEYNFPLELEEQIYQKTIDQNDGRGYDFKAFFYFMWRGILNRYFNVKLPLKNKWSSKRKFICTGLAGSLPENLFPELQNLDLDMVSPDTLFRILLNANNPYKVTKA